MHRTIVGICIAVSVAAVAQDAGPTLEQQAAKCAAQGGCAIVTRDELVDLLKMASEIAYKQGLRACNSNI